MHTFGPKPHLLTKYHIGSTYVIHCTFGPKPHLLTKYHIGSTYVIHCIWLLLAFDLQEGHSHPKLASAAPPTKFGNVVYHIWPLMTFDLREGHHHS